MPHPFILVVIGSLGGWLVVASFAIERSAFPLGIRPRALLTQRERRAIWLITGLYVLGIVLVGVCIGVLAWTGVAAVWELT